MLSQATQRQAQLLEEVCAQHAESDPQGPGKWLCQSKVDPGVMIWVHSQEGMVSLSLQSPALRFPRNDTVALLRRNDTLLGGVKYVLDQNSQLRLCGECSTISCGREELEILIGAAFDGIHEALGLKRPSQAGKGFHTNTPPSKPGDARHAAMSDLCVQLGIDYHESADGSLRIPLMTSRGQRLTGRINSRNGQVHIRLGLGPVPESVDARAACDLFLLSLGGGLRFVRPLLEKLSSGWELACDVVFPPGLPNAEQFQDVLAALSLAGQMSLAELEALHHDELARHYLELRNA